MDCIAHQAPLSMEFSRQECPESCPRLSTLFFSHPTLTSISWNHWSISCLDCKLYRSRDLVGSGLFQFDTRKGSNINICWVAEWGWEEERLLAVFEGKISLSRPRPRAEARDVQSGGGRCRGGPRRRTADAHAGNSQNTRAHKDVNTEPYFCKPVFFINTPNILYHRNSREKNLREPVW